MYIFINDQEIQGYNGEILKRFVGNRLVKTIANPTREDLKEFGYLPLEEEEIPTYNEETQYLDFRYELGNGAIKKVWELKEIEAMPQTGEEYTNGRR